MEIQLQSVNYSDFSLISPKMQETLGSPEINPWNDVIRGGSGDILNLESELMPQLTFLLFYKKAKFVYLHKYYG